MTFPNDVPRTGQQGVHIQGPITYPRPAGTLVQNDANDELYVSLSGTVTSYRQLTGSGGAFGGITLIRANGDSTTYSTIADALAAAVSGDVVLVGPGTYNEDSLTIPAGVRLNGFPNAQNVVVAGSDTTSTRVTMAETSTLREITVQAPSSGANPGILVDVDAAELGVLVNVVMQAMGGTGPLIRKIGAGQLVGLQGLFHNGGTTTGAFIQVEAGTATLKQVIANAGSVADVLRLTGGEVRAQTWLVQGSALYACTDVFDIGGGKLQLQSFQTPEDSPSATNVLHISADGVEVDVSDAHFHSSTWDVLVDPGLVGTATKLTLGGVDIRLEKTSAPAAWWSGVSVDAIGLINDTGVENDPTIRSIGEMSVGTQDLPSELAVGTGDSLVVAAAYLYDDSAGTYTDVTAELQSRTGSTATMPGDVGDRLYVGLTRPFVAVKADIDTAAVLGAGSVIQAKIWTGAAYENIRVLTTDADAPYVQRGAEVFTQNAPQQIRLDIEGAADPSSGTFGEPYSNWAPEDPMGGGTAYYYLVFEVLATNLATAPVFERVKLGLDRSEINADGFIESYGAGQGERKTIPNSGRRTFTGGGSPGNATFALSANVTITVENATFSNNSVEGFVVEHIVPRGVDTSREYRFDVEWTVDGAITGDVELEIIASAIVVGSNIDAGALTEVAGTKVTTITAANDDGVLLQTSFYFAFPAVVPGDTLSVALFRDATAGNPDDTLAGSIKIWDTDLRAVRWTGS